MTQDIHIPPEAVDAAMSEYTAQIYKGHATTSEFRAAMRAAIAAVIASWPGSEISWITGESEAGDLILPLPTEPSDE